MYAIKLINFLLKTEKSTALQIPTIDNVEYVARLLQLSEAMIVSHLETIETSLTLLEAMENFSPHVIPLRKDMLEKKCWCENQLRELQQARD
jgi:hypothetical protein